MSEASDIQKRETGLQRRRQRERQHPAEETAKQRDLINATGTYKEWGSLRSPYSLCSLNN